MASYFTPPWWCQLDECTSPTWKPCSPSSITVLSCLTPHPAIRLTTLTGGPGSLMPKTWPDPSQAQPHSKTWTPFQMPAQASALASPLARAGGHGACSQVGRQTVETLGGQKQLASSSSYSLSFHPAAVASTSKSMEITKAWSKAGGRVEVETSRLTLFSDASMPSQALSGVPSTRDTYQVSKTQPTTPRKAFTLPLLSSYQSSPYPQNSTASSSISMRALPAWSKAIVSTTHQPSFLSPAVCYLRTSVPPSMQNLIGAGRSSSPPTRKAAPERRPWHVPLPPIPSKSSQHPTPYRKNLTPLPSPLCPHCPANQRLHLWCPFTPRSQHASQYTDEDLERIEAVMACAWEVNTHATYVSGLLNFMVFCEMRGVPEAERVPTSHALLLSFVSTLAAAHSGSAVSNYLYGVWAWHILHGVPWRIEQIEMDTMLKATEKMTPPSLRCKKRCPYTPGFILAIRQHPDLQKPLDAAVFTCLSTCFFTTGWVGEFTMPKLNGFNPEAHVSKSGISYDQSRDGQWVTVLQIPCTKVAPQGEDVCWAKQDGPINPDAALAHHLKVNSPLDNAHLFAYRHKTAHRPSPNQNSSWSLQEPPARLVWNHYKAMASESAPPLSISCEACRLM